MDAEALEDAVGRKPQANSDDGNAFVGTSDSGCNDIIEAVEGSGGCGSKVR